MARQHADCLMTVVHDEMTTRLRQAARDVADAQQTSAKAIFEEQQYHYGKACATRNKHAKQLSLDWRDCAAVVKNLKQTST